MEKLCSKCGEVKPASDFYKRQSRKDGLCSQCKGCMTEYSRKRREERNAYYREYYKRNRQAYQETNRRYRDKNPEAYKKIQRKYAEKNPEKRRAKNTVTIAKTAGRMPKASTQFCFMCGDNAHDYHHVDYSKPLEVIPVCRSCHNRWHRYNEVTS